jgi:UbiD family decarboxylase
MMVIIALKQRYPGHARQAELIASQCRAAALLRRYVMVVDDDIDIWEMGVMHEDRPGEGYRHTASRLE